MSSAGRPDVPRFEFKGTAKIQHLNIRKEGPDDDKILTVDIKLTGKAEGRALCAYFDSGLYEFLFDPVGIARNLWLDPVSFGNQIEGALLDIEGMPLHGAKLAKFRLSAADSGVVEMTFSASVQPDSLAVERLAQLVLDDVSVHARQAPGLFDAATPVAQT
jgi:hypothetical protein